MQTHLETKLTQTTPYTDAELLWLLDHIGDPDPAIRDDLVYASFCQGVMAERFSREQVKYLLASVQANQLQCQGLGQSDERTLTRSFTSLLNALFLYADGDEHHPLHGWLSQADREWLFELALRYLPAERDCRGYQEPYGWLHALAHGADFLMAAACHPLFPAVRLGEVWQVLVGVLTSHETAFSAGEGGRLAEVLVQLICLDRLRQEDLANWLAQVTIADHHPSDYAKSLNVQALLSALFFRLENMGQLEPVLRSAILNHPNLTDH